MTDVHKHVLALPLTAVQTTKKGTAVYKIETGKLRRTPVEVGYADHGWVEVRSEELSEATQIIKDASKDVSDGAVVEISKPPVNGVETAGK